MSTLTTPRFHYPESDGKPMADNTLQFEWIVTIQGNLDAMFRDVPDIFVAGDHLIYPVEGNIGIRQAPDTYVAFGRPKGHRGSYAVSEEDGIFPQVIFEVWSPHNRQQEMEVKREFYEKYGAEEYYIVYPEFPAHIDGWRQENGVLARLPEMNGFVSPRLKIKFELKRGKVAIYRPDGERFLNFVEVRALAELERTHAAAEKQRATAEQQRAETAEQRASKLAARLRELGIDPDAV
ncbi:MAG TPA: Uma2 family endonuclease [Gemmata sp.]|jgi:Uma2 family endonuclease|nr:Uma2 family endonuclease [Gemmata sp.]